MKTLLTILCFLMICSCNTGLEFKTVIHFKHPEHIDGGIPYAILLSEKSLTESQLRVLSNAMEKQMDQINGTYPIYLRDFVRQMDPWSKYDEFIVKIYGDSLHIWETRRDGIAYKGWFYLTP